MLSRLTTATIGNNITRRGYNADGSLASEVETVAGNYDSLGLRYDAAGRRIVRSHQDGTGLVDSVRYTYAHADLDSLVVRWGAPSTFTSPRVFRYTWDGLGRRKSVQFPVQGGMSVTYNYDAAGVLRRVLPDHPSDPPAQDDAFDFVVTRPVVQPSGRILEDKLVCGHAGFPGSPCGDSASSRTHDFAYNRLGWLVQDGSDTTTLFYRYDASGNIVWKQIGGLAPDSLQFTSGHNRITSVTNATDGTLSFYYDSNGNRVSEWRSRTNTPKHLYFYDGLGRTSGLVASAQFSGSDQLYGGAVTCVYDPVGRQVQACASGAFPVGLDGENVLRAGSWALVSGPSLDDPLVGIARGAGVTTRELFYITDGRGRQLSAGESDGSINIQIVTGQAQYDGWLATGAGTAQGFQSDRLSRPTAPGLSFFRNRIYDQSTGHWTQEDPLGMAGGLNLYQFNGNNPVTFTDPFGLCPPQDDTPCSESQGEKIDLGDRATAAFRNAVSSAINRATDVAATLGGYAQGVMKWLGEQVAVNAALAVVPVVGEVTGAGRVVAAVAEGTGRFLTESKHLRTAVAAGHDFASVGLSADEIVTNIAAKVEWQEVTATTEGTIQVGQSTIGYSLGVSTKTPGEVILNAWLK